MILIGAAEMIFPGPKNSIFGGIQNGIRICGNVIAQSRSKGR